MNAKVVVCGVGMLPFAKPGASATYPVMGAEAVRSALANAGLSYGEVQQAYVGHVYGDSTCGQRALYDVGMTGIPIVNVNNNCATGSTALWLARQAIASGAVECVLVLGFEQMPAGALTMQFADRPSPLERFDGIAMSKVAQDLPLALRYFGGAGQEHMARYGTKLATFAQVRAKASRHAAQNPKALLRKVVTAEEVLASPAIWEGVMTRLMACPPTCGAAAAVLCSEAFARKNGLDATVHIRAQALVTDQPDTFESDRMRELVGFGMSHQASKRVYEEAGIAPQDVDVIELHDCFAQNELISYEALGLCAEGEAERLVEDGDNTYGGRVVVNPSGGLLSKGHPLGATGLAQCAELVEQLRGHAGHRQVAGARLGLAHNVGLGGACVVTLYERQGVQA